MSFISLINNPGIFSLTNFFRKQFGFCLNSVQYMIFFLVIHDFFFCGFTCSSLHIFLPYFVFYLCVLCVQLLWNLKKIRIANSFIHCISLQKKIVVTCRKFLISINQLLPILYWEQGMGMRMKIVYGGWEYPMGENGEICFEKMINMMNVSILIKIVI